MNTKTAFILSIVITVTGLLTAGCPERKSIADIEANPGRYQNKEVVIAGVVKDSYGITIPGTGYGGGAYTIDDGTGSIWLSSTRAAFQLKDRRLVSKVCSATALTGRGETTDWAYMRKIDVIEKTNAR